MTLNKTYSWQEALSDLITDPKELLALLELDPALLAAAQQAAKQFPLKIPRSFLTRIEKGNPDDPLLKQILPLGIELDVVPGFVSDPLQEETVNVVPGLLHKYHGRVLVTLTSACAIHCRYCFRRHFPYNENNPGRAGLEKIIAYIAQDATICEVILSGGDPLAVNDKLLGFFSEHLARLEHVTYLRFHTRIPVVLPSRITPAFLDWIKGIKQRPVMVLHVNHPQEVNTEVKLVLKQLIDCGVTLLNQSVLLKGVNDNVPTLTRLSETLFAAGVMPYYLHLLDKVAGSAHFDIPLNVAQTLYDNLHASLPGYLVPRFAIEEPGRPGKTWLSTHLSTGY